MIVKTTYLKPTLKPEIALFYGGLSAEHEVSVVSAGFIYQQLKLAGYSVTPVYVNRKSSWYLVEPDQAYSASAASQITAQYLEKKLTLCTESAKSEISFIFPIIHGTKGEDGSIQGLSRFFSLPYAGCSVSASAVCMDKVLAKRCFAQAGIPQLPYVAFDHSDYEQSSEEIENKIAALGFPVFLKPCNMGSSVGIRKVKEKADLKTAIEHAMQFDIYLVAEKGSDVRELEIAILGEPGNYKLSSIGEIGSNQEFYSYNAKYEDENGASLTIDPQLPAGIKEKIETYTTNAFAAVRGEGFARVDFFLDKSSGELYLHEINTLPGFTPISMFPKLFSHAGLEPSDQLDLIVKQGLNRQQREERLLLKEES